MATQKGILSVLGTVGGFNFYEYNGKIIARKAGGGFNGKAIKTKAEMVRVRENASEFGRVSKAKKLVRLGFYPFLKDLGDLSLHGRMMRLFQAIKTLDTISERGKRTFENGLATAAGRALLLDFAFTPQKAVAVLPGEGAFDALHQRYTVTNVTLADLRLPKGATGMQLCFGVLVADFQEGRSLFCTSAIVSIDAHYDAADVVLVPEPLPEGNGVRIAVLQVRYYQEVNGKVFLFNELSEQGLEVVGVY